MRLPSFLRRLGRVARRWVWLQLAWLRIRFDRGGARRGEEWLFGGFSGLAYDDNAAALHAHVREHHPEIEATWVIDRDSPDVPRARAVGPVLYRNEISTFVRALRARVHILSHGTHDIPTCASGLSPAYKVFLDHGFNALKKRHDEFLRPLRDLDRVFDLFPSSSEFEREIKATWGISPQKIVVTGLARYDSLLREYRETNASKRPTILYMPTWREWIVPQGDSWRDSSFLGTIREFLLKSGLRELLAARGARLHLYPHILMRQQWEKIASELSHPEIHVLGPEARLRDEILRCQLLVTDYSSVAWDFLYLDKPVLFFPFDHDRFDRERGSYIDLRHEAPGPVAQTSKETVGWIDRFLSADFDLDEWRPIRDAWRARAFVRIDEENCRRTLEAILSGLAMDRD
jgi:CDP-glycerol glycerophosphotransferase (TagB/SpsB family)